MDRPSDWAALVNAPLEEEAVTSIRRDRPLGDAAWTKRTATRLGLESTLRDLWRPKKRPGRHVVSSPKQR